MKLVLEALCIMKGVKPIRMKDPASGRMIDDYWEASKGMLMASDFLDALRAFDKDHIDPATIKKIKPYIDNPEFMPEKILSVRMAVLCYVIYIYVNVIESPWRIGSMVCVCEGGRGGYIGYIFIYIERDGNLIKTFQMRNTMQVQRDMTCRL